MFNGKNVTLRLFESPAVTEICNAYDVVAKSVVKETILLINNRIKLVSNSENEHSGCDIVLKFIAYGQRDTHYT